MITTVTRCVYLTALSLSGDTFRILLKPIKRKRRVRRMSKAKGLDVVLKRPLVLKIRSTCTIPKLSTVLLMGPPITFNGQRFATFSTRERLGAMLTFVMCLKCTEVLQGLSTRMVDVVLASFRAAITWQPQDSRRLGCTLQRVSSFSEL